MLERALETDEMLAVVGISVPQLVEDRDLLEAGLVPEKTAVSVRAGEEQKGSAGRTDIDSWLRMILMATSLPSGSPGLALTTRALTTAENMPLPMLLTTW